MRLKYFYVISALGGSIGLLEVRHEIEHRKQALLVYEMLYLTEQSIQQTGVLLGILSEHTGKFKKMSRHKEADLIELRNTYNVLSSANVQFKTNPIIHDQGLNHYAINQVYTTLKDSDALLKRMQVIVRKEIKPIEKINPLPILRGARLQYSVGFPIQGQLDMFLPVSDMQFTQAVVDGNTIANPKFPLHVQMKFTDIELTIRNPVTLENTVFRNTGL